MNLIEEFGVFSGYKINNSKSELMFLNEEDRQKSTLKAQFKITTDGFKYLGINNPRLEQNG